LGLIEIQHNTTLADVRKLVDKEGVQHDFPDFVFLFNGVPLLRYEERDKLAHACLPDVFIRGKELKKVSAPKFTKKVEEMHTEQARCQDQENEFLAVMRRVREGNLLKNTNQAFLED